MRRATLSGKAVTCQHCGSDQLHTVDRKPGDTVRAVVCQLCGSTRVATFIEYQYTAQRQLAERWQR